MYFQSSGHPATFYFILLSSTLLERLAISSPVPWLLPMAVPMAAGPWARKVKPLIRRQGDASQHSPSCLFL